MGSITDSARAISRLFGDGGVVYRPEWVPVTGSINATLLLAQVAYWWNVQQKKGEGDSFYKFMAPCDHPRYRQGDSWIEELGMTTTEFRSAFEKIGTRITKDEDPSQLLATHHPDGTLKTPRYLVRYRTDSERVTWYTLNVPLLAHYAAAVYQLTEESANRKVGIPEIAHASLLQESSTTIHAEINTETSAHGDGAEESGESQASESQRARVSLKDYTAVIAEACGYALSEKMPYGIRPKIETSAREHEREGTPLDLLRGFSPWFYDVRFRGRESDPPVPTQLSLGSDFWMKYVAYVEKTARADQAERDRAERRRNAQEAFHRSQTRTPEEEEAARESARAWNRQQQEKKDAALREEQTRQLRGLGMTEEEVSALPLPLPEDHYKALYRQKGMEKRDRDLARARARLAEIAKEQASEGMPV